jgi:hypothetical protein
MDSKKIGLLAVGAGALYLLATSKGSPVFKNMQGQPIIDALCGSSATFDVPGYKRVWLSQLKNKVLNFDGPFDLPMPAYVFSCTNDIGVYDIAVYEIDANDVKGTLIGQTTFTVHPNV